MADPSNEVYPYFALDCYQPLCDALMDHAENPQQVLEDMVQMWTIEHNQRADRVCLLQEREAQHPVEAEAEREQAEVEKKKPKMNDFDNEVEVRNVIIPHPSQYVVLKLKFLEFIELWCFSPEGCRDVAKSSSSTMEDTFGISKVDDILTMHPIAALKQSCNVVNNCDLPILDFFQAKNSFLVHVKYAGWPKKHINALAEFFWHLENHPICNHRHGDTVMLLYAHHVHRSWHDNLKCGTAFNISKVNDTLMNTFNKEV
ncbi:hypothetical protein PAXRUDRAFT_86011, partial [Paxillus rubicundulus Ve08.2h10]